TVFFGALVVAIAVASVLVGIAGAPPVNGSPPLSRESLLQPVVAAVPAKSDMAMANAPHRRRLLDLGILTRFSGRLDCSNLSRMPHSEISIRLVPESGRSCNGSFPHR